MGEVRGAIERVHVPAIVAARIHQALLFAENIVAGPVLLDAFADQNFGLAVRYGDQVGLAFVLDLYTLIKVFHQQSACLASDPRHGRNKVVMIALRHK